MLKKIIYKLYYTLQLGGVRYVWLRVTGKLLRNDKAKQFMYKKAKETASEKYSGELIKIYGSIIGEKLDLQNPHTINEKIQWIKLYDATLLKTRLTDKYLVREWVKEKVGEQYLVPLLGVWDTFSDINISELPDAFALKTNHGCGWNVLIKDKKKADWIKIRDKFDCWMNMDYAFVTGFEMQYSNIPPKIIAEKYIEDENGNLYDYKIHCFHGNPEYIHVIGDRDFETHSAKEAFYNTKWELQPFVSGVYHQDKKEKEKPVKLNEMLRIAKSLSQDFLYVRVDLYQLSNGEIKFGEMTFTPGSGFYHWVPPEMDKILGERIKLPCNESHKRL